MVGSANNQLADVAAAGLLARAGVVYAPDFVANAGGLINIAQELAPGGYDRERALRRLASIETTLTEIFARARQEGCGTLEIAERMAREQLHARGSKRGPWRRYLAQLADAG